MKSTIALQSTAHRSTAKRIICSIVAVAAVFAFLPFNALGTVVRAAAANAPWYMEDLYSFSVDQERTNFTNKVFNIANPIFADGAVPEFSSNSASGWEATTAANAVMGVVNTTAFDTFKGRQGFPEDVRSDKPEYSATAFMAHNPSSSHTGSPNVMVMANKSASGTAAASFSQKLDEFWADGYFEVKVDFYAVRSVSAIYLVPSNEFTDGRATPRVEVKQVSIAPGTVSDSGFVYSTTAIPNLSIWQTATFLVKTDKLESVTFKLSLHLGHVGGGAAGGVVYYDNVRVTGYSAAQFEQKFEQAKTTNNQLTTVVDLSAPAIPNTPDIADYSENKQIFENFNNENTKFKQIENFPTPDNTNILPHVRVSNISTALNMKESGSKVFGITKSGNQGAMLLSAVNTRVSLQYKESIRINRNDIYMINFYALSNSANVGYFRIRDTRQNTLGVPDHLLPHIYNSGFMPVKLESTASSRSHNNWVLNTVFVVGEALDDIDTYFEFWIGGENSETGYLLVDDFSISRVSGQYYEKHKSTANATDCNLSWLTPTATIDNANFNIGVKRSNISAFPLVATGWQTNLEGEEVENHFAERRIINGIVNTDTNHWNANNITFTGEQQTKYNLYGNAYGDAHNPFQIWHNQQSINNNIYMMQNVHSTYQTVQSNSFSLASATRNVIAFDAATYNLSNREVWAIIEIGGREVTRLQLVSEFGGISGMSGWRNFSIVVQTSSFTSPETRLTFALGSSANTTTGALFIDNVRVHESSPTAGNITVDLNDVSKLFKRTSTNEDIGGESLFFVPEDANTASAFYSVKSDVLALSTIGAAKAVVTNSMTDVLQEETAYEYIVRLADKGNNVSTDRTFDSLEQKEKDKLDWGISIRINGMDGGFVNLKTEDFKEMPRVNGLIELRFLIKSGAPLDLALAIEFGNEDVIVQGSIGIKGLELNEYNDEQFNSAKEDVRTRIITTSTVVSDTDDGEKDSKQSLSFLIIPSLITAAAIIFAVAATFIRRSRFKLHIGKHHTSYARDDFETKISKKDLKAPKAKKAPKKKPETSGE